MTSEQLLHKSSISLHLGSQNSTQNNLKSMKQVYVIE